mmetsp:Transcript_1920/g.2864  ORF Transcript_1920/g.2864 Transcript_1920/m.2864 type:complete len:309 (-) Transcript_1920:1195-2121(-)|eukprot:CAMPEP_0204838824 /NCGR_PEP_ID=MMETSP1346-20131115/32059_1 /ASSEMBLY_ACC=CAM_ASM_000771 /TAXON_ID=215587 /ORGANISM="Aplanochytrium stocchinoi, Strain GSBS06" /LENGTH=308 /DNA_ID=CAMNT_0051975109 /DNA_START=49 /DNA_END=975 /DNA_ORIENTATION=+
MVATDSEEYAKWRADALEHVSRDQLKICAKALLKHVKLVEKKREEKQDLFDEVESAGDKPIEHDAAKIVQLIFTLRQTPAESFKTLKGHRVKIPNSLVRMTKDLDVCLLVKDKGEVKKWLADKPVESVQKVISLKQLRTEYNTFQSRRDLMSRYDVFLADDRIVCMLPKTLGKIFYKGTKKPVPVRLAQKGTALNLEKNVRTSLESTYFYLSGSCCAMRIGRTHFTPEQICDNAVEAITTAVHFIPKRWKNVQAIHMKTGKSTALPVYNQIPDGEVLALEPEKEDKINEKGSKRKKGKMEKKKCNFKS